MRARPRARKTFFQGHHQASVVVLVLVLEAEARGGFGGAEVGERFGDVLLAVIEADKEASDDERSSNSLSSFLLLLLLLSRRFSGEVELEDNDEEGARAASMSEPFLRRSRFIMADFLGEVC